MSHKFSHDFSEEKWIAQVRQHIDEDDDSTRHVCIFKIPKIFLSDAPELYVPQQVSIGPYHYLRDEVYGMEKFKLSVAKRTRKKLQCSKFEHLVEQLFKFEMKIRACYNNLLDFKTETLAWMMAIDACFMIEIMDTVNDRLRITKEMPRLRDCRGYKLSHNIILQDLVMLENQIPLFVLQKVLEFHRPIEVVEENLLSIMLNFCKELSPLSLTDNNLSTISDSFHLLDFLYKVIIIPIDDNYEIVEVQEADEFIQVSDIQHSSSVWTCKGLAVLLHGYVMTLARKVMVSRLVKLFTMFSWKILSNIPPISMVKQPLEYYLYTAGNEGIIQPSQNGTSNIEKPSSVEEIKIPSVSELSTGGINFLSTSGGISTIRFDIKTKTIFLPKVYMDMHTEVALKNLILYEALVIQGPMILARYAELMNGIIDTDEDVRLLRENGIIINYLKSDHEVTNLWNGMRKSIKSTKVAFLDQVIEDINNYYDTRWQVKARQFMNLYVIDPWKFLICLGIIFFLLLVMIQTLFSIYKIVRF